MSRGNLFMIMEVYVKKSLSEFPEEILEQILRDFSNIFDLLSLRTTCKVFHRILAPTRVEAKPRYGSARLPARVLKLFPTITNASIFWNYKKDLPCKVEDLAWLTNRPYQSLLIAIREQHEGPYQYLDAMYALQDQRQAWGTLYDRWKDSDSGATGVMGPVGETGPIGCGSRVGSARISPEAYHWDVSPLVLGVLRAIALRLPFDHGITVLNLSLPSNHKHRELYLTRDSFDEEVPPVLRIRDYQRLL